MRTITVEVFTFEELNEQAKKKALEWANVTFTDYFWERESMESVKAFCDKFGVSLKNYEYGPCTRTSFDTDCTNQNFRGLKLKDINREEIFTGYCLDNDLMYSFYDAFKASGDALAAFNTALDKGFKSIVSDWEAQYTDENMGEFLEINEYEFTADGKRYK